MSYCVAGMLVLWGRFRADMVKVRNQVDGTKDQRPCWVNRVAEDSIVPTGLWSLYALARHFAMLFWMSGFESSNPETRRAKYNRRSAALARTDVSEAEAEAPFVFGVFLRTA